MNISTAKLLYFSLGKAIEQAERDGSDSVALVKQTVALDDEARKELVDAIKDAAENQS